MAWLAFVVGARIQYGDLAPISESLDENNEIPSDAELFPRSISGLAEQGSSEYLALGCATCHTQQVRLVEAGFDVERGWGERPSMARDYVNHDHVMLGNTRIGPDLANFGVRQSDLEFLHQHLFEPQSLVPESVCPPSPFLYDLKDSPGSGTYELFDSESNSSRFISPTIRAVRLVSYLQSLKQDYELPEMAFVERSTSGQSSASDTDETVMTAESNQSTELPSWLARQISSGKVIYMKAAPGGGLCFTCHQPNGQGLAGQFPPLAGSDWVLGDKERLIKISIHGLMGEIEVNGVKYNNVMAPPGIPPGSLTDQQIADVLTYVRNDWGNSASAVTPLEVAGVRSKIKDRAPMQMWTSAELHAESD